MGVPRKENAEFRPIRVEDCDEYNNYANYDLSETDELNEHSRRISVEQLHPMRNKTAKKLKMAGKMAFRRHFDDIDTDGVNVKRNMGMRKWRRVEHARIMLTFTDLDDICEDGSDIATPPTTAFDKLFADRENMKLWNEFCSRDEMEQRRILNGTSKLQQKTPDTPTTSSGSASGIVTSCSGKSPTTKKAGKRFSPYSGAACFDRIDPKSRMALLGKKVNWAFVDFLERELRNVFRIDNRNQQDTEAVFIGHYPASSDRLLAHIVAQWLGLSSQSITDPNLNERITEFRNRRPLIPPQTTLIDHLEARVMKRCIEFVPFSMRDGAQEEPVEHDLALDVDTCTGFWRDFLGEKSAKIPAFSA
ncbi:R3H-associated N-terminal domain-containing protein [Caenorhabditis elegans]|uniref:R3H-associated N-terminal domain-containing protein n=1 Tax=Caenorhabditis elegans TaxID=6239 RepID=A5HWA5_CAEEL|nr:R3H-associated N-terminal domain-containing protein [Caenorhabditis elegans]CAN86916.1 R3H-associated N-terminal domain-containing protein [Caenorhabditis elegans]|eukprot:NP_001122656.1 Uncharacterized protein CELE_Y46G5A.18 [Caenorhabditis elegans]